MALIGFVGLCLLVGTVNGAVVGRNMGWLDGLAQPPGAPPGWLFAPVWTGLYVLTGVSAWLVWQLVVVGAHRKRAALQVWGWQVLANAVWPPLLFGLHSPGLGLAGMGLLLGSVGATMRAFWPLRRAATTLLLPMLAWVGFAGYLTIGLCWLNGA